MQPNFPVNFQVTNGLSFVGGDCTIGPDTGLLISMIMEKAFVAQISVYWEVWQVAPGWWNNPSDPNGKLHDILKANGTYNTTGGEAHVTEVMKLVEGPNDPSWLNYDQPGLEVGAGFQFFIRQWAFSMDKGTYICNSLNCDDSYVKLDDMTTPYPTPSPTTPFPTEHPVIGVATAHPTSSPVNDHHHAEDDIEGLYDDFAEKGAFQTVTALAIIGFLISLCLAGYIVLVQCFGCTLNEDSNEKQQMGPSSPSVQMMEAKTSDPATNSGMPAGNTANI